MHSSSGFAATAALLAATLIIAAPVTENLEAPRLEGRSTFSVPQMENPGFKGFIASGVAQRAKAYAKYGAPMPADVLAAVQNAASTGMHTHIKFSSACRVPSLLIAAQEPSRQTHSNMTLSISALCRLEPQLKLCPWTLTRVPLICESHVLRLIKFSLIRYSWVFSTETPSSEVNGQALYDPGSSSSAQLLSGYSWSITYGDGSSSSGDVYDDVVSVGGVSYAQQAVESAQQVSSQFSQDSASSGLLGLAFSSINTVTPNQQNTFFANVMSSLASPVFTANLKKGTPGAYDFGFIDSSKYTGSITYTPVNTANGFWEFTGSGYAVGTGSFKKLRIDAIADTGTTLLLVPDSVVSAYYAKVSGAAYDNNQGGYVFPCSAKLPSFTFGVGSYRGVIPGSYINYAPVSSTQCYGGIQSDAGIGFSIYGDILLKAQFVVFDGGNTRLGFANKPT